MIRLRPDLGIPGEGERAFPQLVSALDGRFDLAKIASLLRFAGNEPVANPPEPRFLDKNELPVPDRTLVDRRYYDRYEIDSVQTQRGCPLPCDCCTYPIVVGRVRRARDPDRPGRRRPPQGTRWVGTPW